MTQGYRQSGFTLTEIAATLALAGITAALAIPSFKNVVADSNRVAAGNDLVATLHSARGAAIAKNEEVTLCPSRDATQCSGSDWTSGWIFFVDQNVNRQRDAEEELLGVNAGFSDIAVVSEDFTSFIAFGGRGEVMGDGINDATGELMLCDSRGPEFSRSLVIYAGGKAKLVENRDTTVYQGCPET